MPVFLMRTTLRSVTNWVSVSLPRGRPSKRSRRRWPLLVRRNGKNTTMDGRYGTTRVSNINVTSGPKVTGLFTHDRNTKMDSGCWEFARPDNIIVTNLVSGEPALEQMPRDLREYWLEDQSVIFHHHQRGADELPHRGLKEFGSEQLPFKRFGANQAYYYMMLVSFFLFETFKEDNLKDILPITSYATTVRRTLIDFAAKVVRTGRESILKVPQAIMDSLKLQTLWARCQNASPIPLIT